MEGWVGNARLHTSMATLTDRGIPYVTLYLLEEGGRIYYRGMFFQTLYTFLTSCFVVLFVEFLVLNLWFSKRKEPKVPAKRLGDSAKLPEVSSS